MAPGAKEAVWGADGVVIAHKRAPERIWKKQKQRGAAAGCAVERDSEWGLAWWHWSAPFEACAAAALARRGEQGPGSKAGAHGRGMPAGFLPGVMLAGAVCCLQGAFLCWQPAGHADRATTSCHMKPKKSWIISKGWMKFPYQASFTVALLKSREVCLCGRIWVLL